MAPFVYRIIKNIFYLTLDNEDGEAECSFLVVAACSGQTIKNSNGQSYE